MVRYEIIPQNSPELAEFESFFREDDDGYFSAVVLRDGGKIVEIVGVDGGEPEDQSLRRDWSWVDDALNGAYQLGYDAGYSDGLLDADEGRNPE